MALSWGPNQQPIIDVDLEVRGQQWVFQCGSRQVSLDWTTGQASE